MKFKLLFCVAFLGTMMSYSQDTNSDNSPLDDSNKFFPIYRGCNEDLDYDLLKKCTTEKIMDFIKLNIDVEEMGKLFPLENSTQFQANFVIDKKGTIKDIKVKAHKREMAALAIKTLKRLPKLKLPKSGNKNPSDTSFEFLMTLYFD